MEALRDSLWQFIGVVITCVALATTVIIAMFQRERRRLEFTIESSVPLVTLGDDDVRDRMSILFDSKLLQDVYLLMLRVRNAGNRPIRPTDFVTPLRFRLGHNVRALEVHLLDASPSNLGVNAIADDDSVVVSPLLLNRRDCFRLKIFVNGAPTVTPDARIVGVDIIEEARRRKASVKTMVVLITSSTLLTAADQLIDGGHGSILRLITRFGIVSLFPLILSLAYEELAQDIHRAPRRRE